MTYRDMTFCSGDGCVKFNKCFRALTHDVEARAKSMNLPISQFVNPKEVDCYEAPKSNDLRRQSHKTSAA